MKATKKKVTLPYSAAKFLIRLFCHERDVIEFDPSSALYVNEVCLTPPNEEIKNILLKYGLVYGSEIIGTPTGACTITNTGIKFLTA